MAKTDILTATETYGKAVTAFNAALANAANAREAAMYNLGADITTPSGKVLTPDQAGKMLGGEGFAMGTKMTTGFGDTTLPTIQKEQTATTAEALQALGERGVGGDSGLAAQQRTISGEAGAIETQKAVQSAQADVATANAEQAAAAVEEQQAEAAYRTVAGQVAKSPKKKPNANQAQARAAAARASARAAANQKAIKAGKPMPYGAGGAAKPVPQPGVKPTPRKKR